MPARINCTLGIYYCAMLRREGDTYFSIPPFARYLNYASTRFNKIVLMEPVTDKNKSDLTGEIISDNIEVIPLPWFTTTVESIMKKQQILRVLKRSASRYDALWLRYPAPYGDVLYKHLKHSHTKIFMQVVGDPLDAVMTTDKYSGMRRYLAMLYAVYKQRNMINMSSSVQTFTNGSVLYNKFSKGGTRPNVHNLISSALLDKDYYKRDDSCLGQTIKLIYVGYLQKRKGLKFLLEAFRLLEERYPNVELVIIGDGEERDAIEMFRQSNDLKTRITITGFVGMGEILNELHRQADIFVYPTIAGEGTPRAILHAMANSLPVVCTHVAGIPDLIEHRTNGLLVEPKSSSAIVAAVSEIIDNGKLRKTLISNGFATACKMSMKAFLDGMFEQVFI